MYSSRAEMLARVAYLCAGPWPTVRNKLCSFEAAGYKYWHAPPPLEKVVFPPENVTLVTPLLK